MPRREVTEENRGRYRRYATGFPIRCTQAEKDEIFAKAEHANRSASRFLVELALLQTRPVAAYYQSQEELLAMEGLMVQLRRVASNLQELACREQADASHVAAAPSAAEIEEVVLEVRGMLDQIRARLI